MRIGEIDRNSNSSSVDRKIRRRAIAKETGGCYYCPPHDVENRGRRPREDRGKNHRRSE